MPRTYDICLAQCPFFISSGKKHILCEGVTDDCTIVLKFTSEKKRNSYREFFCDKNFKNCEICKTLYKTYE